MSQTEDLKHQAYERIRGKIARGEVTRGDRVNSLQLSRDLGMSRTPVREALARLASEGLLEHTPGAGMRVAESDPDDLREVYDLRIVLETFAVRQAMTHMTDRHLERLEACCDRWLLLLRRHRRPEPHALEGTACDRWIQIDQRFHRVIRHASGNRRLVSTLTNLNLVALTMRHARQQHVGRMPFAFATRTYRQHCALTRAMRSGDADLAATLMQEQLEEGKRWQLEHLEQLKREDASSGHAKRQAPRRRSTVPA